MIRISFIIISALILMGANSSVVYAQPAKVPAYFQKMFIPGGFDSNDHIQIVGEGRFSNSCFRQAETHVRIDDVQKKIFLGPVAYSYPGICLMVIVPYQKTVDVGILKPGKWEIIQATDDIKIGEMSVLNAASKGADDYLYAPISQGFFYQTGTVGHLALTGEFSNSCMRLDHVKITIEPQVISVQPIATMDQSTDCKEGKFPFSQNTEINNVPAGRYLLHIRSLNGNAINSLVNVE